LKSYLQKISYPMLGLILVLPVLMSACSKQASISENRGFDCEFNEAEIHNAYNSLRESATMLSADLSSPDRTTQFGYISALQEATLLMQIRSAHQCPDIYFSVPQAPGFDEQSVACNAARKQCAKSSSNCYLLPECAVENWPLPKRPNTKFTHTQKELMYILRNRFLKNPVASN
jgi:hypothetical protein